MGRSIREVLTSARAELLASGSTEADLEAELLLCRTLGWTRAQLYGHLDEQAPPAVQAGFLADLARRTAGEPLAYIVGEREFYGRPFRVTRDVLIPRPETEALVEEALRRLGGRRDCRVLDVGTGSGAIAVTLALEAPSARVVATDISRAALLVARENARELGADMCLLQASLADALQGPFDVVVANLPYVPAGDQGALQREIRDWEPDLALFAGGDGLALIRALIGELPRLLAPGGCAVLECMARQADEVQAGAGALRLTSGLVLQGELPVGVVLRRAA